jgi:galactokinase
MGKEGMRQIVTIDPDPTYREAAANIRKEARAAERERLAAEQKKRALKAVRIILAIKAMAKNHDFEIVGHLILRDHNSGKEYREGGIR